MANPRKFSEKIALHNQKQAEETAAFEKIMREVSVATTVPTVKVGCQYTILSLFLILPDMTFCLLCSFVYVNYRVYHGSH